MKGGNLCLNYAVFNQRPNLNPNYFMLTFKEKFNNEALILNYKWSPETKYMFFDETYKIYLLNSNDYFLYLKKITDRNYVVKIKNITNQNRYQVNSDYDIIVEGNRFRIDKMEQNKNSLFAAILNQIDSNYTIKTLREEVVNILNMI